MIRIGTIVWFVLLALLGVGLFQVKYAVQAKERDLRAVNRQITADRQILRVLEAEWSYLNDPVRLADLTRRHTDLVPAMASQIAGFDALRERPANQPLPDVTLPDTPAPLLVGTAPQSGSTQAAPAQQAALPPTTSAPNVAPAGAEAGSATFQTSSAGSVDGTEADAADEDATIRAILADMEAKQNAAEAPAADLLPATGAGGAQ
ncbi:hypothetical protein A8950_0502 [Dongia mobilis]|uniref:Cell division protein FtsL n=1 Tax=Dongia mobilis TaxID=578943 RepID=A0A4R6WWA4_9PROT|nr:hypothetical protein [Dongia mobilis]TDQ83957.1 hypothetical protein A8950_0502 [Dongia mobilis]